MCNTHVRMGRHPDPFSFDARVNVPRIAIPYFCSVQTGYRYRTSITSNYPKTVNKNVRLSFMQGRTFSQQFFQNFMKLLSKIIACTFLSLTEGLI